MVSSYGPLISAFVAIGLFYSKIFFDKRQDDKQKKKREADSLKYFVALLKRVIDFAEKQLIKYEEHSRIISEEPFGQHLMQVYIAEDLNRILNKVSQESIFHAYLAQFEDKKNADHNKKCIETFQKIFGKLDLISATYEQATTSQRTHSLDINDRLAEYKDLSEEKVLNYSALLSNAIKQKDPLSAIKDPFYNALNDTIYAYHLNAPDPITIEYMQQNLIAPLKEKLVKDFRSNTEAMKIIDNCRKATWLYNETISKSKLSSEEFKEHCNTFKETVDKLKSEAQGLIDIF